MKRQPIGRKESAIYPGIFIPPPEVEAQKSRHTSVKHPSTPPLVNLDEFRDHFKMQVVIPGIKKENILITVRNNSLNIIVCNKKSKPPKSIRTKIHEFDKFYFEKEVLLPDNADAAFIRGEYKDGILMLLIPKGKKPDTNVDVEIVIY